jgi:hypothetical protein
VEHDPDELLPDIAAPHEKGGLFSAFELLIDEKRCQFDLRSKSVASS